MKLHELSLKTLQRAPTRGALPAYEACTWHCSLTGSMIVFKACGLKVICHSSKAKERDMGKEVDPETQETQSQLKIERAKETQSQLKINSYN